MYRFYTKIPKFQCGGFFLIGNHQIHSIWKFYEEKTDNIQYECIFIVRLFPMLLPKRHQQQHQWQRQIDWFEKKVPCFVFTLYDYEDLTTRKFAARKMETIWKIVFEIWFTPSKRCQNGYNAREDGLSPNLFAHVFDGSKW